MDLTNLVDVAIGLCLVYLGASLFVTIVNEYIGQVLRLRGRQLAGDLKQLINDEGIQKRLKASPALAPFFDTAGSSFKRQWKLQSYVDPNVLARLLVGGLSAGQQGMSDIVSALNALPPSSVKDQLLALARSVGNDVNGFVRYVSDWVDRSLTMLGEAYKRRIQVISFVIGIVIAIAFNLDTITLAGHLYRDKDARTATSAAALELVRGVPRDSVAACLSASEAERAKKPSCNGLVSIAHGLQQRDGAFGKLPIGWPDRSGRTILQAIGLRSVDSSAALDRPALARVPLALMVLGWVLTALAISLGASFWFDTLNKLVNVRHGMKPPTVEQETT